MRRLLRTIIRQDKVYIVPTGFGLVFLASILIMILTGATYSNNLIYLLGFMLFSVLVVAMVLTHNNLKDIRLEWVASDDGFQDEEVRVRLRVLGAAKGKAFMLEVAPQRRKWFLRAALSEVVEAQGQVLVDVPLQARRRGRYEAPPFKISTTYPLGLFRAWKVFYPDAQVFVFPKRRGERPLTAQFTGISDESLQRQSHSHSAEADFYEHKPYVEGESFHRVDWKLLARQGRWMTRRNEGTPPTAYHFELSKEQENEAPALEQISLWIDQAVARKARFGLKAFGQTVPLGEGPLHARRCWRLLTEQPRRSA